MSRLRKSGRDFEVRHSSRTELDHHKGLNAGPAKDACTSARGLRVSDCNDLVLALAFYSIHVRLKPAHS